MGVNQSKRKLVEDIASALPATSSKIITTRRIVVRFIAHLPGSDHEDKIIIHQVPIAIINVNVEDIRL